MVKFTRQQMTKLKTSLAQGIRNRKKASIKIKCSFKNNFEKCARNLAKTKYRLAFVFFFFFFLVCFFFPTSAFKML